MPDFSLAPKHLKREEDVDMRSPFLLPHFILSGKEQEKFLESRKCGEVILPSFPNFLSPVSPTKQRT